MSHENPWAAAEETRARHRELVTSELTHRIRAVYEMHGKSSDESEKKAKEHVRRIPVEQREDELRLFRLMQMH